jgi:uncharacterized protein
MLPNRLLELERTDDARVVPRWLGTRDEVWLRELAAEALAAGGRRVGEVDERIASVVAPVARKHGANRKVVSAVWTVERRRWSARVDSPVPPRKIRRTVFELAAERSRDEALATAACELGLDAGRIEELLFADRAHLKVLAQPDSASTTSELADRYNLALVQSLLARATEVTATVRAYLRRVVGYAKLLGLMATFEDAADGATRMTLSGPLALFHDTVKYGNALARWFPALVATPAWSLGARIMVGGETLRLELDARAPLSRTFALPRAHDSRVEAWLETDLRRLASPWRIEREVAVVRTEPAATGEPSALGKRRLFFPDFALISERGRVLVEIVGYWTPEYLASKTLMLRALRVPAILCVDERHARGELARDPRVLTFKKRIDAPALLDACAAALVHAR